MLERLVQRPLFFLHSLTSAYPLSLISLRALISEVYLTRHDLRLSELERERRAGRPRSKEHLELAESRRKENAEWETGFGEFPKSHCPGSIQLAHLRRSAWLICRSSGFDARPDNSTALPFIRNGYTDATFSCGSFAPDPGIPRFGRGGFVEGWPD